MYELPCPLTYEAGLDPPEQYDTGTDASKRTVRPLGFSVYDHHERVVTPVRVFSQHLSLEPAALGSREPISGPPIDSSPPRLSYLPVL